MTVVDIIPLQSFPHYTCNNSLGLVLFCIRKHVPFYLSNIIDNNSWLHKTSNNNPICKEIFMSVPCISDD